MRPLILALAFMTRLPVPRVAGRAGDAAAAMRLYPLAGVIVGALVAGAGWAGARIDPWLGGLAALVTWIGVTGALHLDGLGDMADGLGAAHGNRARLLAVMADPHVGGFGVVAIGTQLVAKLVLARLLPPDGWPLLAAAPAAARLGPLLWSRLLPALKPHGLGVALARAIRWRDVIGWSCVLAVACIAVPPLLIAPPLLLAYAIWAKRRLGGVTGDVHGAGIEFVETGLLLAGVIWARMST